jgi:hypothetical protein
MRRCIFHLLHLNFESEYKRFGTDGGVGVKVRDWLKQAEQRATTSLHSTIEEMLDQQYEDLLIACQFDL